MSGVSNTAWRIAAKTGGHLQMMRLEFLRMIESNLQPSESETSLFREAEPLAGEGASAPSVICKTPPCSFPFFSGSSFGA